MKKFAKSAVLAVAMLTALPITPMTASAEYASVATAQKTVLGHDVQLVYVNLADKNMAIETVPANGTIGQTESLAQIASENNALAAMNGGYFNAYTDMQPLTVLKTNGTYEHNGSFGAVFGADDNNNTYYGRVYPTIKGGTNGSYDWPHSWYAWGINHYYDNGSAIAILTPDAKTRTISGGKTVIVRSGVVTSITTGDASIPSDGFLIHYGADVVKSADVFKVGDTVQYKVDYADSTTNWDNVSNIMGGGPLLVRNGAVVVDPILEKFTDPKQTSHDIRSTRTFIGVTDSNRLVMGTVSGVTVYELADVAKAVGLVNAVAMDSGASAGLYANGSYLTSPGRELPDAIIVKLKPRNHYEVTQNDKVLKSFASSNDAISYAKQYAHTMVTDKDNGDDVWDNYRSQVFQKKTYLNDFASRKAAISYAKQYAYSAVLDYDSQSYVWSNWPLGVFINNEEQSYDVPPVMKNNRVLVPMRGIFEKLGCAVSWDQATQTVTATKGDTRIQLQIGSTQALVNGQATTLDTPAVQVNDRTMVPTRFVAEALGAEVTWNGVLHSVSIKTN